ncbi:hypothetical protein HDU86_002121 [Geranomyces michiganensis]|nr:hypothetical protein HDU86_002121 [Geranomyces michiganensis]
MIPLSPVTHSAATFCSRNSPTLCASPAMLRRSSGFSHFKRYPTGEVRRRDERKVSISNLAKAQKKHQKCEALHTTVPPLAHSKAGRQSAFKRKQRFTVTNTSERQRLQRLKKAAYLQLDKQIRREQMALVQRIRYLESLPVEERELLLFAERAVETEDHSEEDELLEELCAIDIAQDDYVEILQFENNHDLQFDSWSLDLGAPGDLF